MQEADEGKGVAGVGLDELIPEILTDSYFEEEVGGVKSGSQVLRQDVEARFASSPEEGLKRFEYLDLRRRRLLGLIGDYKGRLVGLERGMLTVEMFLNIKAGEELEEDDPLKRALKGEEPMFMNLIEGKLREVPLRIIEDAVNEIARKAGLEEWERPSLSF